MSERDYYRDTKVDYNQKVIEESRTTQTESRNLTSSESSATTASERVNIGAVVTFSVQIRNHTPLTGGGGIC